MPLCQQYGIAGRGLAALEEGGDCVLSEGVRSVPDHADGLDEGFEGCESGEEGGVC
jgi:hypothetical protein